MSASQVPPQTAAPDEARIAVEAGCLVRIGQETLDVGDLDQRRNLKIRTFVRLGLRPVFEDLQTHLRFQEMGASGIAPGQYFEDFQATRAPFGYDKHFHTTLRLSLRRAVTVGKHGPVERLVMETRAALSSRVAQGMAASVGFEPPLGSLAPAGSSRVIHVLTRPKSPPGERYVTSAPPQLEFMAIEPFDGEYPTPETLARVDDNFAPAAHTSSDQSTGI